MQTIEEILSILSDGRNEVPTAASINWSTVNQLVHSLKLDDEVIDAEAHRFTRDTDGRMTDWDKYAIDGCQEALEVWEEILGQFSIVMQDPKNTSKKTHPADSLASFTVSSPNRIVAPNPRLPW